MLIAGTTGSGKTELARTMIASLAQYNPPARLRLILIDPKGRAYRVFAALPHLVTPVMGATDAPLTLHRLVAEMERRDRVRLSVPCTIVFIDELADLLMTGGDAHSTVIVWVTASFIWPSPPQCWIQSLTIVHQNATFVNQLSRK